MISLMRNLFFFLNLAGLAIAAKPKNVGFLATKFQKQDPTAQSHPHNDFCDCACCIASNRPITMEVTEDAELMCAPAAEPSKDKCNKTTCELQSSDTVLSSAMASESDYRRFCLHECKPGSQSKKDLGMVNNILESCLL